MINKVDRGIIELQADAETMYQNFQRVIECTNVIISTYDSEEMGGLQIDPTEGSVAFGSGYFGWAFTLTSFAEIYSSKFKIEKSKLMKKLWGDNYYNPEKKCFQTHNTTESGKKLDRCFV